MKKIQEISTTDNIATEADLKLKADTIAATGCADITVANGKADVSSLFSSGNTTLASTIQYGYELKATDADFTATDGGIFRIGASALTRSPTVTVPVPADGKTAEFILRFAVGASIYSPSITAPSGVTIPSFYLEGDDIEAAATGSNQYEQLVQIVPIDTSATPKTYEIIITTRKMEAL